MCFSVSGWGGLELVQFVEFLVAKFPTSFTPTLPAWLIFLPSWSLFQSWYMCDELLWILYELWSNLYSQQLRKEDSGRLKVVKSLHLDTWAFFGGSMFLNILWEKKTIYIWQRKKLFTSNLFKYKTASWSLKCVLVSRGIVSLILF